MNSHTKLIRRMIKEANTLPRFYLLHAIETDRTEHRNKEAYHQIKTGREKVLSYRATIRKVELADHINQCQTITCVKAKS